MYYSIQQFFFFPTFKDLLDYEVDSDDEWEEEEPGESLSNSEVDYDWLLIMLSRTGKNPFCNTTVHVWYIKILKQDSLALYCKPQVFPDSCVIILIRD